ncbi:MAG: methyltransferase MtaB domain-containing protein [Planctomycetota bacterium]
MQRIVRTALEISDPRDLVYGAAPRALDVRGLSIGGGEVYPEINFTLPPISIDETTWPEVLRQYRKMAEGVAERAADLEVPGLVVEFEHLPPMTERPRWGAEVTALLRETLDRARERRGLRSALRVTIVDLRDATRPPRLRSGPQWEAMLESWRLCARAGADILSIESVGGKEVHDRALLFGDVRAIAYALGVLAARDMEWLWNELAAAAAEEGSIPGADSACGFANTAMLLAGGKQVPEVLAAVVRAMTVPRSLVAFECGARGPSKDCAYEGTALKVIAGCPISMEGKSAACAHLSPIGNIACMAADLWSNESVQNVKLLSGPAPTAFLEILAYDCRLLNAAAARGRASWMRDLLEETDELRSPQALVLGARATYRIARAVVENSDDDYRRTVAAGRAAVTAILEAAGRGPEGEGLRLSAQESRWLERIEREFERLPEEPASLEAEILPEYGELFDRASYGLVSAEAGR